MSLKTKKRVRTEKSQPNVDPGDSQRLLLLAGLIFSAAVVFALFFQINKIGPLRAVNPFLEDPYDAIGSFGFQVAFLVGLLSYARALRLRMEANQVHKASLVLRGDALVLLAITITLAGDSAAIYFRGLAQSPWGTFLLVEVASMWILNAACVLVAVNVSQRISPPPPPTNLTPADAIDDLWILARLPVARLRSRLPGRLVQWVERFSSDRLFGPISWLNPRLHPWRFATALGLVAGIIILLAKLREGLPPSMVFLLLVSIVFLSIELAGTLIGFTLFGGYLGLRPPLKKGRPSIHPSRDKKRR